MPFSIAFVILFAGVPLVAQDSRPASHPSTVREVAILHTNDIHGTIRAMPDPRSREGTPKLVGGIQELCAAIDDERFKSPNNLLLDAGDWYQGTPEGTLSKGLCSVELMNAIGFDAAVLGNHDFDNGASNVDTLLGVARFPVFGVNIMVPPGASKPPYLERITPGKLFITNGVKIFVDGILTEEAPRLLNPGAMGGALVEAEITGAQRAVSRARQAGAEALVLVNHVGKDRHLVIGRDVQGIDVLIGGHNHRDVMDEPVIIPSTGTLIAQAAPNAGALGVVTFGFDTVTRKVAWKKSRLRRVVGDPSLSIPRLKPIIDLHEKAVAENMDRRVAEAPVAILRSSDLRRPTPLGNLLTEQMLAVSEADIAVHNINGIRADLPAGTIRVRDLFMVSPFGNTVVTVKLPGKHIRALVERHLANPSRGFVFRGITTVWRESDGRREIVSIMHDGKDLDDERQYSVVTTDYLANAADGASPFSAARERRDLGMTLLDVSIRKCQEAGRLNIDLDAQWVEAPKKPTQP